MLKFIVVCTLLLGVLAVGILCAKQYHDARVVKAFSEIAVPITSSYAVIYGGETVEDAGSIVFMHGPRELLRLDADGSIVVPEKTLKNLDESAKQILMAMVDAWPEMCRGKHEKANPDRASYWPNCPVCKQR